LYEIANPLFTNPSIFKKYIPKYAESIAAKIGYLIEIVWGFIDGTLRKTCRPS
jgi:hypothetical protein